MSEQKPNPLLSSYRRSVRKSLDKETDMGLFDSDADKVSPAKLQLLKDWVYETLALDRSVPISISQLKCTEPGCSPLETVIAVMNQPPQTYKIHRPTVEIEKSDVVKALNT